MKRYGTARQATDDNIMRHIRVAYCINKVTDTHSDYVIIMPFHNNNGGQASERAPLLRLYVTLGRVRVSVLFDKPTLSGTHPEVIPC
jgi:hypothetical protein